MVVGARELASLAVPSSSFSSSSSLAWCSIVWRILAISASFWLICSRSCPTRLQSYLSHIMSLFIPYANNKGADRPAHPCSLISTFVVSCLDSIIPILAKSKISRLDDLCRRAGWFESYMAENLEDRFSRDVAHFIHLSLRVDSSCKLNESNCNLRGPSLFYYSWKTALSTSKLPSRLAQEQCG